MANSSLINFVLNIPNCSTAQKIVTPHFQIAVLFEAICGLYAFISNVFLLAVGWRVGVFPPNLRLLIGHLSFILAWYGLGGFVKGLYLLTTPVCDLAITQRNCRVLEVGTTNTSMVIMFLLLSTLVVERLFATVRYRRYDRTADTVAKPYLAIFSIVAIWIASLAMNLSTFASIPETAFTAMCDSSVFASRSQIAPYLIFYLCLEAVSVVATIFIYAYNRHMLKHMVINRALYDLSSRFRVDQNVQVNVVMMPSMILHLLCYLPNYALMLLFLDMDHPTKATLLHVSYLWRQVYAGAHPTLAFALNVHLKQHLRKNFLGRCLTRVGVKIGRGKPKTADVGQRSKVEGDAHFKHLEDIWSGVKPVATMPRIRVVGNCVVETNL